MIINEDSGKRTLKNVEIKGEVQLYDFINAYNCTIGNGTKVGAFVEIQEGVVIGEKCKISSHSFICEGVTIGNGVFIGHNVSFINTILPRALNADGQLQEKADWTLAETVIEDGVSIGTSATIMGNVRIGKNAVIGAGTVVLHDVPENAVVVGNPGRIVRYV